MLKPTYVAEQIVKAMQTKKREVNLPKWMGMGPKLYALFPGLFERVAGKSLSKNRRFPYGNLLFFIFQSHNRKRYPQLPRIRQFDYSNE
ncbi:hypothetical protein AAHH69_09455 [Bacillus toyonensis]